MGIGKTILENWSSSFVAIQLGGNSVLYGSASEGAGSGLSVGNNFYYDGSLKRISNDEASRVMQYNGDIYFETAPAATPDVAFTFDTRMYIDQTGNVGIGTNTPGSYKLAVVGKIRAYEVVVENGWSDFVFADDFRLKPLNEVEQYIQTHKHLPDVPSAEEVAADGLSLGETQALLLQKIEELTLYVIDLKKENQALKARIDRLEK